MAMGTLTAKWTYLGAAAALSLFLPTACTSQSVNLVNPQSGATTECSGSGFGLAGAWLQGYIDDCIRRSESRGYVAFDKLTPEQRDDLERRGLLPKSSGAIPSS
jgi:hypothetical protein